MMRRVLGVLTVLSSMMMTSAFAETAVTPPTKTAETNALHAAVTLKQEGQRLYAYVVLNQTENASGKIMIDWTPPAHSSCDKSSYSLAYQGNTFHTRAYRTLGYSLVNGKSVTCTGTWKATIKNDNGIVLTTQTIAIQSVDAYANNAAKLHELAVIA